MDIRYKTSTFKIPRIHKLPESCFRHILARWLLSISKYYCELVKNWAYKQKISIYKKRRKKLAGLPFNVISLELTKMTSLLFRRCLVCFVLHEHFIPGCPRVLKFSLLEKCFLQSWTSCYRCHSFRPQVPLASSSWLLLPGCSQGRV